MKINERNIMSKEFDENIKLMPVLGKITKFNIEEYNGLKKNHLEEKKEDKIENKLNLNKLNSEQSSFINQQLEKVEKLIMLYVFKLINNSIQKNPLIEKLTLNFNINKNYDNEILEKEIVDLEKELNIESNNVFEFIKSNPNEVIKNLLSNDFSGNIKEEKTNLDMSRLNLFFNFNEMMKKIEPHKNLLKDEKKEDINREKWLYKESRFNTLQENTDFGTMVENLLTKLDTEKTLKEDVKDKDNQKEVKNPYILKIK